MTLDYDKMRSQRKRLACELRVPEKPEPHYSWQWTDAMEGGPVLPDAVHWKSRYEQSCNDIRDLRDEIDRKQRVINILRKQLFNLGGAPFLNEEVDKEDVV